MRLNTSFRAIIYLPHSLGPSFLSGAFQAAGRIHSRLSFPTITSPESWYEDSTRPVKFFFSFGKFGIQYTLPASNNHLKASASNIFLDLQKKRSRSYPQKRWNIFIFCFAKKCFLHRSGWPHLRVFSGIQLTFATSRDEISDRYHPRGTPKWETKPVEFLKDKDRLLLRFGHFRGS